jgi:hypothetical protein
MTSSFTWLDYSESERRAMLDVVDLFREQDTRDELGLAPIRDALSDRFFPGTIVPQTRARVYLFVPWIYRRLEERRVAASEIARELRAERISRPAGCPGSSSQSPTLTARTSEVRRSRARDRGDRRPDA